MHLTASECAALCVYSCGVLLNSYHFIIRGTKEENKAVKIIATFLRGVVNRKLGNIETVLYASGPVFESAYTCVPFLLAGVVAGLEYTGEFADGPLGMEIENCSISAIVPGGQASRTGVIEGSRIQKVGSFKVQLLVHVLFEIYGVVAG